MIRFAITVVERAGKFLLVRHRTGAGRTEWNFPAGRVKGSERDVDTAVREVQEETGVIARPIKVLGERELDEKRSIDYWLCEYVSGEARPSARKLVEEVRWATPRQVVQLLTVVFAPVLDYLRRASPAL